MYFIWRPVLSKYGNAAVVFIMAPTYGSDVQNLKARLLRCQYLLQSFHWLTDSFVLDFFTENHWKKLPKSWADALDSLTPKQLAEWILSPDGRFSNQRVLPLSLLAFGVACKTLPLERTAVEDLTYIQDYLRQTLNRSEEITESETLITLKNVFRKHVKPKKKHELEKMSSCCALVAKSSNCKTVIDVGAGIGHLSRYLSFGYGLKLVCVESEGGLGTMATKLDSQLLEVHSKQGYSKVSVPQHITQRILPNTNLSQVLALHFKEEEESIGLIGLHTCGDLGPTMIRNFAQNDSVQFILAVGCCYMKMNIKKDDPLPGFPMSSFIQEHLSCHSFINYEALEVACHSIDSYCDRLLESDFVKLKVHCYRAALETVLVKQSIRRAGLRSVKNAHLLSFEEYAMKGNFASHKVDTEELTKVSLAVEKLDGTFELHNLATEEVDTCLNQWMRVVSFYTLRLLLAPVIETIVQLDRLLFLSEQGFMGCIVPMFDSRLSPRNFTLLCVKPQRESFR